MRLWRHVGPNDVYAPGRACGERRMRMRLDIRAGGDYAGGVGASGVVVR